MEPVTLPLNLSSPPSLDDDDREAGSDEEEFGGFSDGVPCPRHGYADSTELPSSFRKPSPPIKPATHQPNCSFNHPVDQPSSIMNPESSRDQVEVEGQHCNPESSMHLTNGHSDRHHISGIHTASISTACSPEEETGFADFTMFTEQAANPWCCGFSPMGSTEQWNGGVRGKHVFNSEKVCVPGHEVIMNAEPRSHCACKVEKNGCIRVKQCQKRDADFVQSSQDHFQSQEAATAKDFPTEEPHPGNRELSTPGDRKVERKQSLNSILTSELQNCRETEEHEEDRDESFSTIPRTFIAYDSAIEDLSSLCDDNSFEDMEPNVSSLASQEDQTDWDQTDEELGDCMRSDSWVSDCMATLSMSQSEAERGFQNLDQSATQETSATSNQSPVTNTEVAFADFKDVRFEHHRNSDHIQTVDEGLHNLGSLPQSDSFADFCSAPTQEEGDASWAEFKDQRFEEKGKTWTERSEHDCSLQMDGDTEEEPYRTGEYGKSKRDRTQASLSCRVQQLLQASFPAAVVPPVRADKEVPSLGALLHHQHLPESEEEEIPEYCSRAQWIQRGISQQDVHSAVGLQFQWGGSQTNRTLLRCLGVDTRNIVFVGMKRQPVSVPVFASNLGMLEPTKDSMTTASSPGHTAVTQGARDALNPSTDSVQEPQPSSQLDWSSRGLSSSQDGCSALDLDYFGPEEESSSCGNTPPPGVDPDLYELTISKLETSVNSSHLEDTLLRLMSTAEKTSTSVRKPQQDEELSDDAAQLISGLPTLAFMQAKVLMFPSFLIQKE